MFFTRGLLAFFENGHGASQRGEVSEIPLHSPCCLLVYFYRKRNAEAESTERESPQGTPLRLLCVTAPRSGGISMPEDKHHLPFIAIYFKR